VARRRERLPAEVPIGGDSTWFDPRTRLHVVLVQRGNRHDRARGHAREAHRSSRRSRPRPARARWRSIPRRTGSISPPRSTRRHRKDRPANARPTIVPESMHLKIDGIDGKWRQTTPNARNPQNIWSRKILRALWARRCTSSVCRCTWRLTVWTGS